MDEDIVVRVVVAFDDIDLLLYLLLDLQNLIGIAPAGDGVLMDAINTGSRHVQTLDVHLSTGKDTGDLIEWVDKPNAVFRFKSRKNDLINVGGYKVNPEEVELEIMAIGGVCQANVYGKANSILGEVLCADVVMAPNVKLTEQDIRMRLSLRLQDFKIPRRIRFVEELSVTRTGKLKRI